jgi:molecular chaperone DnaJ
MGKQTTVRKEWLEVDYYSVLGVGKDASDKDIKRAYRKLAQQYHPDTNAGDATAEARFKEVNEAYAVVGDAETRKEYDHMREVGYFVGGPGGNQQYVQVEDLFRGGGAGGSPFDLFGGIGDLFGPGRSRSSKGRDLSADVQLSFHDSISGTTRTMTANGQTIKVKIPQGVADGARIRVRGKGAPGPGGGPAGDLYVTVRVGTHPIFARSGTNLGITVPVTFAEAALGAEVAVPTLEGKVTLRIPPGTQSGKTFRVSGKGVTTAKKTGDLLVTVDVVVPTTLTDEQRTLLEKFRDNDPDDDPRVHLGV